MYRRVVLRWFSRIERMNRAASSRVNVRTRTARRYGVDPAFSAIPVAPPQLRHLIVVSAGRLVI